MSLAGTAHHAPIPEGLAAADVEHAPVCAPPDPSPRRPLFVAPPGATDCHAHIFGPATKYPYSAQRVYTPPDSLMPQYLNVLRTLGVERAVLVQPSVYGTDNRPILDAIAASPIPMRGVAVVEDDITDKELDALHEGGVRGVRYNICDVKPEQHGKISIERVTRMASRIKRLGWHVQFLMRADEFADLAQFFADFPTDVVIDHFGYMKQPNGPKHPSFQSLLRLLERGRTWVKVSRSYSFHDATPFAKALLAANKDRLVWGSDWPHPQLRRETMPNDGDLFNKLLPWMPDEESRRTVLADNPAKLYDFS